MKRTDIAKNMGKKIAGRARPFGTPGLDDSAPAVLDKRERRKLDQAAGLVPFACKLNAALVAQVRALAEASGTGMNETVAELLAKGLAKP